MIPRSLNWIHDDRPTTRTMLKQEWEALNPTARKWASLMSKEKIERTGVPSTHAASGAPSCRPAAVVNPRRILRRMLQRAVEHRPPPHSPAKTETLNEAGRQSAG